jgi:uncharacterized protein
LTVSGDLRPFKQFVLKIHSRCDLACDHCYVYEHADQSWRGRPMVISPGTVDRAGERIAEHVRDNGLSGVRVILHGGEPLLAGLPRLAEIARSLRRAIEPSCDLDLRIHTNGVRLDAELCELFLAERVKVGISLDGDQAANDLHRRYANGRSSYEQVVRAVGLLRQPRYREIYAGLLATIDVRSDPAAVYHALAALDPPNLDFLLPHGTWDSPPPGAGLPGQTPYADWLGVVFDEWTADSRRVPIRIFESIIATTLGGASLTESLGLEPSDVLVIETDGEIEQADSIKVAYDGAPATGLDIFRHALSAAALHPGIRARQQGIDGLNSLCRQCPVVTSCGGGLYAHRYRTGRGFDNPSVYCADLEKIITTVRARLQPGAADQASEAGGAGRPVAQLPWHELPEAQFDEMASGYGGADAISCLAMAQRSIGRALLRFVYERASTGNDLAAAGWKLLRRLDHEAAPAVDEVLTHPYLRAWAERCLPPAGAATADSGPRADAGHLASVAAAAAVRAGASAEIEVPVTGGYVHLPTLGRLRVGDIASATLTVTGADAFEVRAVSGKWHVGPGTAEQDQDWEPVRELRAGDWVVRLEDTDPYRDCHQWPATPRMTTAEVAAWQAQFEEAARLIESGYPRYAPGVAAGLSVLLPLANDVPGREISASAREAFGAVAAALPPTGADLALLIIHEFQHVKLGALMDMFDLHDRKDRRLYYAPWREDPRPLPGLLQGTYAHIGVTDYWRLRRGQVAGQDAAVATQRFARWRTLTAEAIETLAGSGALTPLGERFVAGMRATVEPWLGEPVPAEAASAAARESAEHAAAWRRREGSGRA